jgi:hypothetical protein
MRQANKNQKKRSSKMNTPSTQPSQDQSHPSLADEPFAAAMATLSTRSLKERMLIGKLLLLMSKATAEIHYSLERDVIGITWRTRTRVIAEASTLYRPALVRIVDGEGRTLVVWAACLHRSHGRIARGLCGLGRHVVCGPFPDEAERFEERVARFLGRELNQEDDWCPEWEE